MGENVEIKEKIDKEKIQLIIRSFYENYRDIRKKIADSNKDSYTKFYLGGLLSELDYKIYLLRHFLSDEKNLNDNNINEILNYLNKHFQNLNIENAEIKLGIINIEITYFMDKLLFPKKENNLFFIYS